MYENEDGERGCRRRVSKDGLMTIPKRFHERLGVSVLGGGYIWIEPVGEDELRVKKMERAGTEERASVRRKIAGKLASIEGADAYVKESLQYYQPGRVDVQAVQQQYAAWIAVQGGTVPAVNVSHLGRAIKKAFPQVRRGRTTGPDGEYVATYRYICFRQKVDEAPDMPAVIVNDEPDGEPPTDAAGAAGTEPPESAGAGAAAGDSGDDILDVGGDDTLNVITDDQVEG